MRIILYPAYYRSLWLQLILSRPVRVACHRACPLILTAPLFILGQHLALLFPEGQSTCWINIGIIVAIWFCIPLRSLALGIVSALPLLMPAQPVPAGQRTVLLVVQSPLYYGRNEEVSFEAFIHEDLQEEKDSPSLKGIRLFCRAPLLPWFNSSELFPGALVAATLVVRPRNTGWESPFDLSARFRRRGLAGSGTVQTMSVPLNNMQSVHLQEDFVKRVQSKIGNDEGVGILLGMTLGQKGKLSLRTERAFRKLGLGHVLVVSGYHLGIVLSCCMLLLSPVLTFLPVTSRFFARRILTGFALLVLFAYCVFIGETPSNGRALIAACILFAAGVSERGYSFVNSILFAGLLVTVAWPGAFFEIGVQYTFVALFAIALALCHTPNERPEWWRVPVYATLATVLVTLFWFETLSLTALFANCVLAPLVTFFICNLGFIGLISFAFYEPLGCILLKIVRAYAYLSRDLIWYLADFPWSEIEPSAPCRMLIFVVVSWRFMLVFRDSFIRFLQWQGMFPYHSLYALQRTRIDL